MFQLSNRIFRSFWLSYCRTFSKTLIFTVPMIKIYNEMKKFLLLTSFMLTLLNCSNDLVFNDQAFQATIDNEYWKATEFGASIEEDGTFTITAALNNQVVTLTTSSLQSGTYQLGVNNENKAVYKATDLTVFSTLNNGDGEIVIENYDPVDNTITGSFRFNAYSLDGLTVNFNSGVLYRVPLQTEVEELEEEGQLRATVDDSDLIAEEVTSIMEDRMIQIVGTAADGSYIKIYIPENTPTGNHNLNQQSASGTYAVYAYPNGVVTAAQFGTLFITEHDMINGRIQGTFTFTTLLPNSVFVENGLFTAYY